MIDNQDVIEFSSQKILENIAGTVETHSDYLLFRCPFCGDSKKSLKKMRGYFYKNLKNPYYKCFNGDCEISYSAFMFVAKLENKSIQEIMKEFYLTLNPSKLKRVMIHNDEKPILQEKQKQKIELDYIPSNWHNINNHTSALEYLNNRKFFNAPNLPKNWNLYFNIWNNRIVFPWLRNNKLIYYQERTIQNEEPKYLFPPSSEKEIFNLDNIDSSFPFIFYTEGMMDSIYIKNGIAIGGITLTEYQKDILHTYTPTAEIIFFSQNYWKDEATRKKIFKLYKSHPQLKLIKWSRNNPYKDINDEIIKTNDINKYYDINYLKNNLITISRLKVDLQFAR